ncbi:MAG: nitroreductase [Euryarchaeota archaeon]|nr:nitroreductase [Euryarchaeota archaeon]
MDVMNAIRGRRSIRKFQYKEIPAKVLEELLEAARLAPSAGNRQAWELIVITDQNIISNLVPICKNQQFINDSSVFLAAVTVPGQRWTMTDLTIMIDHVTLAAYEKGLGSCWIGAFDQDAINQLLGVPEDRSVAIGLALGYPAEYPSPRSRKSPQELFHWNKYGQQKQSPILRNDP